MHCQHGRGPCSKTPTLVYLVTGGENEAPSWAAHRPGGSPGLEVHLRARSRSRALMQRDHGACAGRHGVPAGERRSASKPLRLETKRSIPSSTPARTNHPTASYPCEGRLSGWCRPTGRLARSEESTADPRARRAAGESQVFPSTKEMCRDLHDAIASNRVTVIMQAVSGRPSSTLTIPSVARRDWTLVLASLGVFLSSIDPLVVASSSPARSHHVRFLFRRCGLGMLQFGVSQTS
jgi:hypothetical protein